ncbi:hypothetical protein DNTS_011113 [Danionella cerebrum]|uniref:CFAP65 tenth Ig-like domain-containing protein n=1 Tax=Danionella cerebrum TaxID=2873325 RepID=A0A553MMC9_9TELE|nr:hypothetical protein DNTS_011113 [Danionella translucida]
MRVFELYNAGTLPLRFHIDTTPLEKLKEENFHHPVLQCLNPAGDLEPGHTAMLEWIFSPLEAKTYTVDVPIHVLEGDSMFITFEGQGFDEREPEPLHVHNGILNVPCVQRIPVPGQVVFLSEERLHFGDVPVCSRCTRILFMTNVSSTDEVLYNWQVTRTECSQAVNIYPESGHLAPGQSVLCIVTLQTSGTLAFYQQDLLCQITLEKYLTHYLRDLKEWEKETGKWEHEFTITEKDLLDARPGVRNPICSRMTSKTKNRMNHFRKMPCLNRKLTQENISVDSQPLAKNDRARQQSDLVRRRPEPPHPTLLHLGITARSHGLLEYQAHFPSEFNSHYIIRSRQPGNPQPATGESGQPSPEDQLLTPGPERDITTFVLTSLIQGLLDEPEFQQYLLDSEAEQVPYFTQLRLAPDLAEQNLPHISAVSQQSAEMLPGSCARTECEQESPVEPPEKVKIKVQESIRRFDNLTF